MWDVDLGKRGIILSKKGRKQDGVKSPSGAPVDPMGKTEGRVAIWSCYRDSAWTSTSSQI